MEVPVYVVDAFTSAPFTGNPASVCLVPTELHRVADELTGGMGALQVPTLKAIAAEMNHSETAFLATRPPGLDYATATDFHLRWFTPKVEVPLCGHGTLAAATVLFEVLGNRARSVTFQTLSGPLVAERHEHGVAIFLPTAETVPYDRAGLNVPGLDALLAAVLGHAKVHSLHYVPTRKRLLVRLDDQVGRAGLEALAPSTATLLSLHDGTVFHSVTVTVLGQAPYDFFSRHFSPWIGIPEDPVTGSAHSYISTYWASVLDKREFLARQCSPRGGDLKVTLLENDRMRLIGENPPPHAVRQPVLAAPAC